MRQTDSETNGQRDDWTERQTDSVKEGQTEKHPFRHIHIHIRKLTEI